MTDYALASIIEVELLRCSKQFNLPEGFLIDNQFELQKRLNRKFSNTSEIETSNIKRFIFESVEEIVLLKTAE